MLPTLAALVALATAPLDSQVVLDRYAARLLVLEAPKTVIFTYSVSQAGPTDIEQTHRIYRSGDLVRDETVQVDGQALRAKTTRIARYRDRYTIENLAPRMTQYAFLFLRAVHSGNRYSYVYRAVPLGAPGPFVVTGMTVDGRSFLPSEIRFKTAEGTTTGSGTIAFARSGAYWVAISASVTASVDGKPARERLVFGGYQFPPSLPKSTFQAPRPLPTPVLPTF